MITGINHITLSVNDIEESFAFYAEVLKLKPVMKSNVSAYFLAGDTWLALVKRKKKTLQPSPHYDHLALNVPRSNYHAFVRKLRRLGIPEWQENSTEGESFYFLDPSFNKLEIHYSSIDKRIADGKRNRGDEVIWFK